MKNILFLRSKKAYLSDIDAYLDYFNAQPNYQASVFYEDEPYNIRDYDVVWKFMGRDTENTFSTFKVHEYVSLSTGQFPRLKNFIKSKTNSTPDLRIFLNQDVEKEMNFRDPVPSLNRDMGIDPIFFEYQDQPKKFDFVYIGSMAKGRRIDQMLKYFVATSDATLYLVGDPDDDLYNEFKSYPNIVFTGKVPYKEVPKIASQARYGINYMPNEYPLNRQTSTKLLEYLAMGLNIVSTNYKWVNDFEKSHQLRFHFLDNRKPSFALDRVEQTTYCSSINKEDFLWESIFKRAGILEFLNNNL